MGDSHAVPRGGGIHDRQFPPGIVGHMPRAVVFQRGAGAVNGGLAVFLRRLCL